jgi:hypothetical protein
MQTYFSRYSSSVIGVLVFILALSLTIEISYSQESRRKFGSKAKIGQKIIRNIPRILEAMDIQKKHTSYLMSMVEVLGTATGISPDGEPVVIIYTARADVPGIPAVLEGIAVRSEVTGRFYALQEPPPEPLPSAKWPRPVPIGVSTGHPSITAGTIGARVTDGSGIYALSNNHVYAAINNANIGDEVLQPGSADGGTLPDDAIGMLADFEVMKFCQVFWIWLMCPEVNTIDAAIADVVDSMYGPQVRTSTPSNGYGTPNAAIHAAYGTPDVIDDAAEDLTQLLGLSVQKYGRTTELTTGTIDAINATVDVCYDQACTQVARFVEQIIITPGTFSAGGDSGSLIVTNNPDRHPVALLFAGSSTQTIANRIDRVLNRFNVTIDSGAAPTLDSIETSPDVATVGITQTQQYTAMGAYSDGSHADLTADSEWISSNETVATIDVNGLATGMAQGTTDITATYDGITSNVATLSVTASPVTLVSISVTPVNATIEEEEAYQFTATGTYSDESTSDLTTVVMWESSDNGVATIDVNGLAVGVAQGTTNITATYDGVPSNTATLDVIPLPPSAGPHLQTGKNWASSAYWTTIPLDHDYGANMVVVCTPNYDRDPYGSAKMPLVVHVRNASGNSFDIRIVQAVGGAFETSAAWVHWMVVEAGVYNEAEHGVKMEAAKFNSTITDRSGSWIGTNRTYAQPYSNPVVVGQVMSLNSYDTTLGFDLWSVFWCRGSKYQNPPSASSLWVGKHAGEDPRYRDPEVVGYVVIEAGSGSFDTTDYMAGLGTDSIRGVGDSPPYTYDVNGISDPSTAVAILGQAAMDGRNGGWAILYGDNPITLSGLKIAIDEDQAWDTERRHTTEQVGYIVFEAQTP